MPQPSLNDKYDPQTPEDVRQEHKEMKRLLDYFKDKSPTDTMFADHALRVFLNVEQHLSPLWTQKIEVSMEEVFPILDSLKYGRDTILLLSVISPGSYRVLWKQNPDARDLSNPTFALEQGITGPALNRKVNPELRRGTFYEEATRITKSLETCRYICFLATKIQAEFHGKQIPDAPKEFRRVFWRLEDETPEKDSLAIDYAVLAMMKNSSKSKLKLCTAEEEIKYVDNSWFAVLKKSKELELAEKDRLPSESRPKRPKVSEEKKRLDTQKRVAKWRAKKNKDRDSYKSASDLNSSLDFQIERRSRGSSLSKTQPKLT